MDLCEGPSAPLWGGDRQEFVLCKANECCPPGCCPPARAACSACCHCHGTLCWSWGCEQTAGKQKLPQEVMKHLLASVLPFGQQLAQSVSSSVLERWQTGLVWPDCDFFKVFSLPDRTTIPVHYSGWVFESSRWPGCSCSQSSLSGSQFFPFLFFAPRSHLQFHIFWVLTFLGKILISSQWEKLPMETDMGEKLPDLANILPKSRGF